MPSEFENNLKIQANPKKSHKTILTSKQFAVQNRFQNFQNLFSIVAYSLRALPESCLGGGVETFVESVLVATAAGFRSSDNDWRMVVASNTSE